MHTVADEVLTPRVTTRVDLRPINVGGTVPCRFSVSCTSPNVTDDVIIRGWRSVCVWASSRSCWAIRILENFDTIRFSRIDLVFKVQCLKTYYNLSVKIFIKEVMLFPPSVGLPHRLSAASPKLLRLNCYEIFGSGRNYREKITVKSKSCYSAAHTVVERMSICRNV